MIKTFLNPLRRFLQYLRDKLHAALSLPREYSENQMALAFETGKKLSDFVAMIVSLGLVTFFWEFCFSKAGSSHHWISSALFVIAGMAGLVLSYTLAVSIYRIVFHYFFKEVITDEFMRAKIILGVICLIIYLSVAFAISEVVALGDISKVSK